MRLFLAAGAVLALGITTASADCLRDLSLAGVAAPGKTVERGFTITKPGAAFSVRTDSVYDRLHWRILRPNGSRLDCAEKGPASQLVCNPKARRKGYYRIFISNRMKRAVPYTISCDSPP